jgi:hypothetical protein
MMRIGLIVVGLGTLTIMELGTPSRTKTSAPDRFEQLTFDVGVRSDTLGKADRLETYHLQHEGAAQPTSPVELTPPPDVTAVIIPKEDTSAVGRGTKDKKDVVRRPKPKPKHTAPSKPRPKLASSNKIPKTERSKAVVELKPCRTNAFDDLLQVLNLASRCQT